MDSLILCKFLRGVFEDFYAEAADMLRLVTGWDVTADELRETARRIVRAKREFNLLAGWTLEEDTLPDGFSTRPCRAIRRRRSAASNSTHSRHRVSPPARLVMPAASRAYAIVFGRVEIAQRQQFGIDGGHLRRLHAAGSHSVEQEHRTQPILRQQRFDVRQRTCAGRRPTADAQSRRSP